MESKVLSRREFIEKSTLTAGVVPVAASALGTAPAPAEAAERENASPRLAELEKRLDTYGPFPPSRRRIVIFSTGNDYEDHGPAMATCSDTQFAQAFCSGAALRTGIRYLAHAPFTTDPAGDCCRLFCPVYLPEEEYFDKTAAFCASVLNSVEPRPEGVLIHIPWHGQQIMGRKIGEFAERLGVKKARLIPDVVVDAAQRLTEKDYLDSPIAGLVHEGIKGNVFQHAGLFDYCIAEALGHLDRGKLEALRESMEKDLEGTLRRYPAVQGLSGYVRYGGKEFDSLRRALDINPGGPYPPVDPKWQNSCVLTGRAIVRHTIDIMVENVLAFEQELFGGNLWGTR